MEAAVTADEIKIQAIAFEVLTSIAQQLEGSSDPVERLDGENLNMLLREARTRATIELKKHR